MVAGLFLVLTAPGGVLENKVVFWILDKITSIFRAVPFIILLAVLSPFSHLIVGTSIGPNAAIVPLSFAVFAFLPVKYRWYWQSLMVVSLRLLKQWSYILGHCRSLPIRRSSRLDSCDDCNLDFPLLVKQLWREQLEQVVSVM